MNFQTYLNELNALLIPFKNALAVSTDHQSIKEFVAQELNDVKITIKDENDFNKNVIDSEFIQMYNKYWITINIGNISLENSYLEQINEKEFMVATASDLRVFLNIETKKIYAKCPGEVDNFICSSNEAIFFDALFEYQKVVMGQMVFNVERKQFLHNVVKKAGGYDYFHFWEYIF